MRVRSCLTMTLTQDSFKLFMT